MVAELTGCQELNVALPELAAELDPRDVRSAEAAAGRRDGPDHRRPCTEPASSTRTCISATFTSTCERLQRRTRRDVRLALIDLHRLGEHRLWPDRWRWKDLGQLLYSTAGVAGIDDRDILQVLETLSPSGSDCAGRAGRPGWSSSRPQRYLEHNRGTGSKLRRP